MPETCRRLEDQARWLDTQCFRRVRKRLCLVAICISICHHDRSGNKNIRKVKVSKEKKMYQVSKMGN